jgi:hypothetical protein
MRLSWKFTWLARFAAILMMGCATKETVSKEAFPILQIMPNSSGITMHACQTHGPENLLGNIGDSPDVPAGVSAAVERIRPLHNKEPRYFIRASGKLQVVSIQEGPGRAATIAGLENTVHKWRLLLDNEGIPDKEARQILYQGQLSEIPWINAGRCFHAKLRHRIFPWGKAVLFLTAYVQGGTGGPVNNDMLVLIAQGITNDGRYAVNAHFEISHPKLPESSWDDHTKGKAVFDIDEEDGKAEAWLDAQPDDSFIPAFSQYETFLHSLSIK